MPKIINKGLYNFVYNTTCDFFRNNTQRVQQFTKNLPVDSPVYRYAGYRDFKPQQETGTITIWPTLDKDLSNRWTGMGSNGTGSSGLYLSLEQNGALNTSFPELEHYQDSDVEPTQDISYFEYQPKTEPAWQKIPASELRTMFLYTTNVQVPGLDLQYTTGTNAPPSLIPDIFNYAKQKDPGQFKDTDTANSLYNDPNDASFTRAVGNAAFEAIQGNSFILTTSVRDKVSQNICFVGEPQKAFEIFKPQGRCTFFIDSASKTTKSVYTIDDLLYNNKFEEGNTNIIVSQADLNNITDNYTDIAETIDENINWDFVKNQLDKNLQTSADSYIDKNPDSLKGDLDALTSTIVTDQVKDSAKATIQNYVESSAPAVYQDYPTLYSQIGSQGINELLSVQVVQPRFDSISSQSAGFSYISLVVKNELLQKNAHRLSQEAGTIQTELANAQSSVQDTNAEITAKQNSLEEVQEKLKGNPGDSGLTQQQDDLTQELDGLKQQLADQETAQAELDNSSKENQDSQDKNKNDLDEAETNLDNRSQEVFGE